MFLRQQMFLVINAGIQMGEGQGKRVIFKMKLYMKCEYDSGLDD